EVEIEVIDLLGRTMLKHALGQIPSGIISDYEIDSGGWAPGVYYYRIITTTGSGPTIHAGKMMVAR
ncbi:MAG: T9SS type A sorting domain-containing protein, partial [Bacteroidetes bacterium]|nr:T9SS type A sorting domain-containing protein [Bacteroidota bacterium]